MSNVPAGGFVHRIMPPLDWVGGSIPRFEKGVAKDVVWGELRKSYLAEDSVSKLVTWLEERDGCKHDHHPYEARSQLEILAEIDADTIWWAVNYGEDYAPRPNDGETQPDPRLGAVHGQPD